MNLAARVPDESGLQAGNPAHKSAIKPALSSVSLPPLRMQMHPGVYKVAFICWMCLLGEFFLTFFASASALFMVAVDAVFAAVFFGVPWIMNRMKPQTSTASAGLPAFLKARFDTLYRPIEGREALLQVIMVPLALSLGGVAIGFIILSSRALH